MAQLRLANLLEDAALVGPASARLRGQLKLHYHQPAMDGEVYESKIDKHYLYFITQGSIYRIKPAKVPVC